MTPEERARRIKRYNVRRLRSAARWRADADAMLAEIEAAKNDPESQLAYRASAELIGVRPQSLGEMLSYWRRSQGGEFEVAGHRRRPKRAESA